jgi:hypothetical protein
VDLEVNISELSPILDEHHVARVHHHDHVTQGGNSQIEFLVDPAPTRQPVVILALSCHGGR